MDKDISKKTVAVLLLLAIALSITGTWIALDSGRANQGTYLQSGTAKVSLELNGPPNPPASVEKSAGVGLTIK